MKLSHPIAKRINQHSSALDAALAGEMTEADWQGVEQLDNDFRRTIADLIRLHPLNEKEMTPVADAVKALHLLNQKLVKKCEVYRNSLKDKSRALNKGRQGVRAYQAL